VVDVRPGNVTLLAGSSASLQCDVAGEPYPRVRWLRHGADPVDDGHLLVDDGGGLLTFVNVTVQHDGWYECEASNGVGPAALHAVYVDVLGTRLVPPVSS